MDLPKGRLHPDTTGKEGDFSTGGELQQGLSPGEKVNTFIRCVQV